MFVSPTVAETLATAMRKDSGQPPHELLSPRASWRRSIPTTTSRRRCAPEGKSDGGIKF
jgi:hypothetical protein